MLGGASEAVDVTQEALLRLTREEGTIREPAAWITTVVTRLSINVLTSARARREAYVARAARPGRGGVGEPFYHVVESPYEDAPRAGGERVASSRASSKRRGQHRLRRAR
jgi:DNA-directed RNA polymerase specialized sigma24 family protein